MKKQTQSATKIGGQVRQIENRTHSCSLVAKLKKQTQIGDIRAENAIFWSDLAATSKSGEKCRGL
jgi:hypothetical protein